MKKDDYKFLSAGENAIIVYHKNNCFTSLVHNITKDNGIVIYTPQEEAINKRLLESESFDVYFNREDAQYRFSAAVKRQFQEGQLELTEIIPISNVVRNQRREYCRLKLTLPVEVRECVDEGKEEEPWKSAYLVDISASGIKVGAKDIYEIGSKVEVKMRLGDEDYRLKCKILGIQEHEEIAELNYIRMCFIDIPRQQKDSIVSFIFREQLRLRSRGLL